MAGRTTPGWIAAAAALVVGAVVFDVARRTLRPAPAPAIDVAPFPAETLGTVAGQVARPTPRPPPSSGPGYMEQLARAETRRRIRQSAGIAYLHEYLATSTDSMLHRWDNRVSNPVRVHLGTSRVANFQPAFLDAVRDAFAEWAAAGVPVRFNLFADSASTEVDVRWRIQFELERSGQTDLTWNADGHLETGVITFATFDPAGQPMEPDDIRVVALHEVGHLIGLEHSADSSDIMFPVATARQLSQRDRQSARLLYDLAPGSIR